MAHAINIHPLRRSLKIALIFQIAWLVSGVLFTALNKNVEWGLLIANLFTLWAPVVLMRLTGLKLSDGFQFSFAVFVTAASLVGSSLGGYGSIPNWDTIVHCYSGAVLAWFGYTIASKAEQSIKKPLPLWFKNLVAFMTPLALAALWEIYEYMSDTFLGTNMQVGGLTDTIVDMSAAFVGAVVAVIVSCLWAWKHKK